MSGDARAAVTAAFHQEWGRIVGALIGLTGDWDLAEDCAQEACAQALTAWSRDGVPARSGGWLTTVARNRALDRLRRRSVEARKLREIASWSPDDGDDEMPPDNGIADDRLQLIFTCCHPALPLEARVALTLRTLAGLTTAEIARAFLVTEPTMAKRLVRAKQKIRHAGIPYRLPPAQALPERTTGVLAVLYLLFNEGYSATAGVELVRENLSAEAIRLTRLVTHLLPHHAEAGGLLALMLFHDARRHARTDGRGDVVPLAEQDRSRWDARAIDEAAQHLDAAVRLDRSGPYQLQAAIAACHCQAADADGTDWVRISRLYEHLAQVAPSPVVQLNRAVALAFAEGPAAGLQLVDALDDSGALAGYHLLAATRAELLRRLNRPAEAAMSYRRALELVMVDAERRFLLRRLAEVAGPS